MASSVSIVAFAALVLLQASLSLACSTIKGGCTAAKCAALAGIDTLAVGNIAKFSWTSGTPAVRYNVKPVGFYAGLWNDGYYNKTLTLNKVGGPYVNYECFREIGTIVALSNATTLSQCCSDCAQTAGCILYQFFPKVSLPGTRALKGYQSGVQCYLISGGSANQAAEGSLAPNGEPYSGTHSEQVNTTKGCSKTIDFSFVGGLCNSLPKVIDDPHFTGAHGVTFDFNGAANQPFCLISDERLHINTVLGGYEDTRVTAGAGDGKKLRSWITEVGVAFRAEDGAKHTLRAAARKGKQQKRGEEGFLAALEIDGQQVDIPKVPGQAVSGAGGVSLALVSQGAKGSYDMDTYKLVVPGLAEVTLRMRVAHPLLQTPEEAYAHFNLHFDDLRTTPRVHGVLGQTFRNTEEQQRKAMDYSLLTRLLHAPVVADGPSGQGFLDGRSEDYRTSGPLATDCAYSVFSA